MFANLLGGVRFHFRDLDWGCIPSSSSSELPPSLLLLRRTDKPLYVPSDLGSLLLYRKDVVPVVEAVECTNGEDLLGNPPNSDSSSFVRVVPVDPVAVSAMDSVEDVRLAEAVLASTTEGKADGNVDGNDDMLGVILCDGDTETVGVTPLGACDAISERI